MASRSRSRAASVAPVVIPDGDPTLTGYARVSTDDQNPEGQHDALVAAGCGRIYTDHGASGRHASRPAWDRLQEDLRPGDTLVVTKLDRAGRSTTNLIEVADRLRSRDVNLRILDLAVDTSTAVGRMVYTMLGAVAEMEANLNRERTLDGLAAARSRGRVGGRPTVMSPDKLERAREHLASTRLDGSRPTMAETAQLVGVSRRTLYRALDAADTVDAS